MANHSCGRGRQGRAGHAKATDPPTFQEPEVRRWPHPVNGVEAGPLSGGEALSVKQLDALLHYIHCALSYQNQLLADIKALLEQLTEDSAPTQEGK